VSGKVSRELALENVLELLWWALPMKLILSNDDDNDKYFGKLLEASRLTEIVQQAAEMRS
jgi:hypothetical protein